MTRTTGPRWSTMIRLCRTLTVCLALALVLPSTVDAQMAPQGIAAVVNEEVVTLRDVRERLDLLVVTGSLANNDEVRDRLAPQVVRTLVDERLQAQEARRLGIVVTEEEVDRGTALIAQRNNTTADAILGFIQSRGASPDALRAQIRAQLTWVKVVGATLSSRVVVTDEQVEIAARAFESGQGKPEYFLREIVLPVYEVGDEQRVQADAERLARTLRAGGDFARVASQVSSSATAEQGGTIGWVRETELAPESLSVVQEMQPGQVSRPIRSASGYTILYMDARRVAGQQMQDLSGIRVRLSQILFPTEANAGVNTITALNERAQSLRPQLTSCAAVERTADRIGAPASGDLGWIGASDLPPVLGQVVVSLPVGAISQPVRGPAGVHLLMVCDRRGELPVVALQADREQIRRQLESAQLENLARRSLRDLRREAFVDVRVEG
ncbi:peptidylprolyl isomerase [Marinivivus vitaminiproducens]|uniref:peptidylprolyl isomerase n=1 Tax=Marinivivus vitaminiproducens TaxID=3035935 RepID=UPI0027A06879|nr:peptidylprolyl isomerase [Geminicoccaceae bacterium SCSIO 64248]